MPSNPSRLRISKTPEDFNCTLIIALLVHVAAPPPQLCQRGCSLFVWRAQPKAGEDGLGCVGPKPIDVYGVWHRWVEATKIFTRWKPPIGGRGEAAAVATNSVAPTGQRCGE